MPQGFARQQSADSPQTHDEEQAQATASQRDDSQIDMLDAVLNDIETTLDANAQEYVNSFVQKGGE